MTVKPKNIREYKKWLRSEHSIEINDRTETYYNSVANNLLDCVEKSVFWKRIKEGLPLFNQTYLVQTGYHLLIPNNEPELVIKPFDSFFLKTFRKNIIDNKKWPNAPHEGWFLPENWFSNINDIIRTLFIVKYLDGVTYLVERIKEVLDEEGQECRSYLEAREEGYYAAHVYTKPKAEIPKENWDTEEVVFQFELQVTTQLQEVIRKLLHIYYEKNREQLQKPREKWQWNYKSDEFSANYLGHILHYVEGMIMEIREKEGD